MTTLLPWLYTAILAVNASLYPSVPVSDLNAVAIATAIDGASQKWALSPRDGGRVRLAAELVVLAGTEGHFNPAARGRDAYGESLGLWQIHETTLQYVDAEREDAFDLRKAASLAARLVHTSHAVCARRAPDERLGWYSSGGPRCDVPEGLAASRHREHLVEQLLQEHPAFWTSPCSEKAPGASVLRPGFRARLLGVLARRRRRAPIAAQGCS
jgi:hypothetical protein